MIYGSRKQLVPVWKIQLAAMHIISYPKQKDNFSQFSKQCLKVLNCALVTRNFNPDWKLTWGSFLLLNKDLVCWKLTRIVEFWWWNRFWMSQQINTYQYIDIYMCIYVSFTCILSKILTIFYLYLFFSLTCVHEHIQIKKKTSLSKT